MTVDAHFVDIGDRLEVTRSGDRFDIATFTGTAGRRIHIIGERAFVGSFASARLAVVASMFLSGAWHFRAH